MTSQKGQSESLNIMVHFFLKELKKRAETFNSVLIYGWGEWKSGGFQLESLEPAFELLALRSNR